MDTQNINLLGSATGASMRWHGVPISLGLPAIRCLGWSTWTSSIQVHPQVVFVFRPGRAQFAAQRGGGGFVPLNMGCLNTDSIDSDPTRSTRPLPHIRLEARNRAPGMLLQNKAHYATYFGKHFESLGRRVRSLLSPPAILGEVEVLGRCGFRCSWRHQLVVSPSVTTIRSNVCIWLMICRRPFPCCVTSISIEGEKLIRS